MSSPSLVELKAILRLAGPLIAAQLAYVAMVFTDTVMMGKLGPDALAAGGLGAVSYAFVSTFCVGVVAAVGNLVAIRHGCDDAAGAAAAARSGLWVGAALALAAGLLLWNLRPLLTVFGQAPQTVDGAMQFLHSLTFALPGYMAFMVLRGFTSAIDRAGPVMAISVLGALANLALNYSFIEGLFGLPRLGLAGIGPVTALVMNCMPLLLALYIRLQPAYAEYSLLRGLGRPQRAMVEEILRLGLPIGGTYAVESGMFTVATLCMGIIGDHALAAHQIAIQAVYVAFMVPVGLSYATTYRIGQHFGAGRLLEARRAGRVGIGFGALCMLLFAGLFWWMPEAIIGLFLDRDAPANREVAAMAVSLLAIAAWFELFDGTQNVAMGAIRGLRTPAPPSWSAWPATGWSACRWPACWRSRPAGAPRASGGAGRRPGLRGHWPDPGLRVEDRAVAAESHGQRGVGAQLPSGWPRCAERSPMPRKRASSANGSGGLIQ
uniref:Multidrug resistance protein MdtK n=1 Tax=Pseudomonas aeruginosa TaxID=287 RepID=A0A5E5R2B5_PSEAI|nr:Multidrug resistance protein MdtK [Pseudomonas aeruginosa]